EAVHSDTIFVYPQPVADIGSDTVEGCAPLTVNFTNQSTDYSNWLWTIDGNPDPTLNPSYTYAIADTDVVILVVDTAGFCFDSTTLEIRIANPPTADFSPDQDQFCDAPATVTFTNLSQSEVPLSYAWDFGDGNGSTDENPSHTYTSIGHFTVTLTIISDYGCEAVHLDTIFVYPQPVAAISSDTTEGCVPLTVNFVEQAQSAMSWNWIIDGQPFSGPQQTYTYNTPDIVDTVVLVVDTAGFCFDTTTLLIRTASPPLADFAKEWDRICDVPARNVFTDQSQSTRPLSYSWDFGDGGTSVLESPDHVYQSTGTFAIRLAVRNDFGCVDTLRDTVTVLPQPIAVAVADPNAICAPDPVQFLNQSTSYSSSLWDFGDGSPLNRADNPIYAYTFADTSYTVTLVVDTADFCFDTATVVVEIASRPIADFSVDPEQACGNAAVNLINESFTADQPLSYVWDFGQGQSSVLENPTTNYAIPDTYDIQLITRNAFGCEDVAERQFILYPQAVAGFIPEPPIVCQGDSVLLSDLSANATRWQWILDGAIISTEANPAILIEQVGSYTITQIVNYEGECADTLTLPDVITVEVGPRALFNWANTSDIDQPNGMIQFENLSRDAVSYRWYFDDGDSSTLPNPLHQYTGNRCYEVTLIPTAASGCTDVFQDTVCPDAFGNVHFPNAFAPIAEPRNESVETISDQGELYQVFLPVGIGLTRFHVAVYTIWGDLVWESVDELDPETGEPAAYWDGTINGTPAPPDVFVWKILGIRLEGSRAYRGPTEGSLTLIR
ncbi:MAG: PKD domain-containing protein, partial [Bacteroidota bacterium]